MIRRALPHAALLGLLAVLALTAWQILRVIERPPSAEHAKRASAERVLGYRVLAGAGPQFLLDGGRPRLKLSSVAVLPAGEHYDPTLEHVYGLRLIVRHDDRERWRADLWIESRQSKEGWNGRLWAHEAAWTRGGLELADERLAIIDLPEVPVDAVLEVRLLGSVREALVRVFVASPRDAGQAERANLRWDERQKAELVRSSTYRPWSLISREEKQARLERRWLRLPALGDEGDQFTTRAMYLTDFRLSRARADAAIARVSSVHAAAINVQGPTHLIVTPARSIGVRVDAIGPVPGTWEGTGDPLTVPIGAGPHSIVISTPSTDEVELTVSGDHERWIVPADQRAATTTGRIVPDRVRIPLVVIGGAATAQVAVPDLGGALLGRVVRVDARRPLGPGAAPATISVVFRARDGRELGRDAFQVGGAPAPLERLAVAGSVIAVTEPVSFRVVAPVDAARIELGADRDVAIRLARWAPNERVLAAPYRDHASLGFSWRYAAAESRSWHPMSPENHEALAGQNRLAELEAQVRLEPSEPQAQLATNAITTVPSTPLETPAYETVPLRGAEQRARERIADDRAAVVVRDWGAGALTRVRAGARRLLELRPELSTEPRLFWGVSLAAVGRTAKVRIGDRTARIDLYARWGSALLPRVGSGTHAVEVEAPADAELWVNRPPVADHTDIYRDRTLYEFGRRPARVQITQQPGEVIHVYAVIYVRDGEPAPRVRLSIDGGHPARRAGISSRLTRAEIVTDLPASRGHAAQLVDLGGRSAGTPRVAHIGLLDDLAPGRHELEIAQVDAARSLWIRVVISRRTTSDPLAPGGDLEE